MAITLNHTVLHSAELPSNIQRYSERNGSIQTVYGTLAESDKPAIVGSKCLDIGSDTSTSGMENSWLFFTGSNFNALNKLINLWFYHSTNKAYIADRVDGVQLRLYPLAPNGSISSLNSVAYYQYNMGGGKTLPAGWQNLSTRGYTYDEAVRITSSMSLESIAAVGITLICDYSTTDDQDVSCSMDHIKMVESITVTGGESVINTPEQIANTDKANNWGVFNKTGSYYNIKTNLILGSGSDTGRLMTQNEILHFDSPSPEMNMSIIFNATGTGSLKNSQLMAGEENSGHAVNGSIIKHTTKGDLSGTPYSNDVLESEIIQLNNNEPSYALYDSALIGWDRVNIGRLRTDARGVSILIRVEFTKCREVNFIADSILSAWVEVHHMNTPSSLASVNLMGALLTPPAAWEMHNNINSLKVELSQTLREFNFINNTMDIQVLDNVTVNLKDLVSDFNPSKVEVVS